MRTSYSALETYKQCPQKYKFQEIDRVPAAKSKEAIFGTLVHESLRFMFQRDPLFPTLDEVLAYYKTHWPPEDKKYWASPDEEQIYFQQGREMIKAFYAKNAPWNTTVVDLESRFEVVLENEEHPEYGTHILSGKIDRIDKIDDGIFEIIDYKTGKRMPSQKDVNADLQLSVYTIGVKTKWPHLDVGHIRSSLYFLKHGEKLTTSRTTESIEKTRRSIVKTVNEIERKKSSGEPFEPIPSILCNWCAYKPICPMWRHLYAKGPAPDETTITDAVNEYLGVKSNIKKEQDRLDEIQAVLASHMEKTGISRIFGKDGYVTQTIEKRTAYNYEQIRPLLEKLGLWDAILTADDKKLKAILKTIPEEARIEIEDLKTVIKTFRRFTATKKKIANRDAPVDDVDGDLQKAEEL